MSALARHVFRLGWSAQRRLAALTDGRGQVATPQPRARIPRYPAATVQAGDRDFGYGYLDRWRESGVDVVSPSDAGRSRLRVYSHSLADTPAPTHPHALVWAENLVIDFARVATRDELAHRPGYLRARDGYSDYRPGALLAAGRSTGFPLESLPRDHLRDIFGALSVVDRLPEADLSIDEPCLLVTREQREHTNLFHAQTDWLAAFMAVRLLGLEGEQTRLVLLDRCPPGSLDGVFQALFSPAYPVLRVHALERRRVLFRRAAFVAPGYSSPLWARQFVEDAGPAVGLLRDYGRFLCDTFADPVVVHKGDPVHVTLLVRRPYGEGRSVLMRQFRSEEALVRALSSIAGVAVRVADPAGRAFADQIELFRGTEVLVGAHGAGLAHTLAIEEHGALVEIVAAPADATYRLYPHMAAWSGRLSRRLACRETFGLRGTWLDPDPDAVSALVVELAAAVRARRR